MLEKKASISETNKEIKINLKVFLYVSLSSVKLLDA